jgi:hypothetical protein
MRDARCGGRQSCRYQTPRDGRSVCSLDLPSFVTTTRILISFFTTDTQNNMPFEELLETIRRALIWVGRHALEAIGTLVRSRVFLPLTVPQPFQLGIFGLRAEINLRADLRIIDAAGVVVLEHPVHVGQLVLPNRQRLRGVQDRRE